MKEAFRTVEIFEQADSNATQCAVLRRMYNSNDFVAVVKSINQIYIVKMISFNGVFSSNSSSNRSEQGKGKPVVQFLKIPLKRPQVVT